MNDNSRTAELIYVELETVASGMLGLVPFLESMKAQQAMLTSLSQAIQGISDATMSAPPLKSTNTRLNPAVS